MSVERPEEEVVDKEAAEPPLYKANRKRGKVKGYFRRYGEEQEGYQSLPTDRGTMSFQILRLFFEILFIAWNQEGKAYFFGKHTDIYSLVISSKAK